MELFKKKQTKPEFFEEEWLKAHGRYGGVEAEKAARHRAFVWVQSGGKSGKPKCAFV